MLTGIEVSPSSSTVYPVKDGYRDSVVFSLHALSTGAKSAFVSGKAVLSKSGKTVKTWTINSSTKKLVWNGLVGKSLQKGMYTLKVTAWGADGAVKTATTSVQVMGEHLKKFKTSVVAKVKAKATTAKMPKAVAAAFDKGKVTVQIRTVAVVVGKAKLVFSNRGVHRTLVLRNGTHTTKAMTVPAGFKQVNIQHKWKKGTVKLVSIKTLWTYNKLVK